MVWKKLPSSPTEPPKDGDDLRPWIQAFADERGLSFDAAVCILVFVALDSYYGWEGATLC